MQSTMVVRGGENGDGRWRKKIKIKLQGEKWMRGKGRMRKFHEKQGITPLIGSRLCYKIM